MMNEIGEMAEDLLKGQRVESVGQVYASTGFQVV